MAYISSGLLFRHQKEENLAICNNMDGPWRHYVKWNKSHRERQILYDLTYMYNLKNAEFIETENKLVVVWGEGFVGGRGSQKEQTSSYKINKSWGCNVQHGDCS